MITLAELIEATTWLEPQDHIKIVLWRKEKVYTENEFEDIKFTVRNLAKYANYYVSDIDIEYDDNDECFLICMIWQ